MSQAKEETNKSDAARCASDTKKPIQKEQKDQSKLFQPEDQVYFYTFYLKETDKNKGLPNVKWDTFLFQLESLFNPDDVDHLIAMDTYSSSTRGDGLIHYVQVRMATTQCVTDKSWKAIQNTIGEPYEMFHKQVKADDCHVHLYGNGGLLYPLVGLYKGRYKKEALAPSTLLLRTLTENQFFSYPLIAADGDNQCRVYLPFI